MELPSPLTGLPKNKIAANLLNLIEPLLDHGCTLFMDSCFSSRDMALFLKTKGTGYVGPLCAEQKRCPFSYRNKKNLRNGEPVGKHLTDVTVLVWQDRKRLFQPTASQ
jgi:hypothetical protein